MFELRAGFILIYRRILLTADVLTHTHTRLCVFGAPPYPRSGYVLTLCRHLQRRPDTDSQQQNLCRGRTSLFLALQLPSGNLYYFIFPQIAPVLHYLCLFIRSTCLCHWPDYSIAAQAKMHQHTCFPFLPSYLRGVWPKGFSVHGACTQSCAFIFLKHATQDYSPVVNIWGWNMKCTVFLSNRIFGVFNIISIFGYLQDLRAAFNWNHFRFYQINKLLLDLYRNRIFACEWILQRFSNTRRIH